MRRQALLVLPVLLLALIAGCGDGSSTSAPDPADAASCADLADKYVEITGDIIDQIGDRTDADMESPPVAIEAAAEEWMEVVQEPVPRIDDLCDAGEYDELLCDRGTDIEPGGGAGEQFLRDNYPSCSKELPEQTTLPQED